MEPLCMVNSTANNAAKILVKSCLRAKQGPSRSYLIVDLQNIGVESTWFTNGIGAVEMNAC